MAYAMNNYWFKIQQIWYSNLLYDEVQPKLQITTDWLILFYILCIKDLIFKFFCFSLITNTCNFIFVNFFHLFPIWIFFNVYLKNIELSDTFLPIHPYLVSAINNNYNSRFLFFLCLHLLKIYFLYWFVCSITNIVCVLLN